VAAIPIVSSTSWHSMRC